MKYSIILLLLTVMACGQSGQADILSREKEKEAIENVVSTNRNSLIVLAKIYKQDRLIRVIDQKWPEGVEVSFNIFKNDKGQIIYFTESPVSESGDWNLIKKHYFNEQGQSIAFEKVFTYFSGNCTEGLVDSKLVQLYDDDFKVVKITETLTDDKGKELDKLKCGNANDEGVEEIRTVSELIKIKKIQI